MKREKIQKLQKDIEKERHRINLYEKQLEEDAVAFEKFVKEKEQSSQDAVHL